jgi:hypothetical protein
MSNSPENPEETWLVRLARTRADLAIAAGFLLAFFFYKGGFRLTAWLVVLFLLSVGLFRVVSWALGKKQSRRTPPSISQGDQTEEPKQLDGD